LDKIGKILEKVLHQEFPDKEEGLILFRQASLSELIHCAWELRKKIKNDDKKVSWIIDRNVNITNVCCSQCKFCNFYRKPGDENAYITTIEQYKEKISELKKLGGNQLLLQGGLHPRLGLSFYADLFSELKKIEPGLKLHALGPPEIHHLSRLEKIPVSKILERLADAGLDSLPGAGAEILSDRVRKIISPVKCTTQQWLDVMREAHKINLVTSATMMFGHVETDEEILDHLLALRQVQSEKPASSKGFISFTPWPYQEKGTDLQKQGMLAKNTDAAYYVRLIALSRIMLQNVENIQASWLTVGKDTAQVCLHAGANDFGSIMIEENVVSSAGASYKFDAEGIQKAIIEAGFEPVLRDQGYNFLSR